MSLCFWFGCHILSIREHYCFGCHGCFRHCWRFVKTVAITCFLLLDSHRFRFVLPHTLSAPFDFSVFNSFVILPCIVFLLSYPLQNVKIYIHSTDVQCHFVWMYYMRVLFFKCCVYLFIFFVSVFFASSIWFLLWLPPFVVILYRSIVFGILIFIWINMAFHFISSSISFCVCQKMSKTMNSIENKFRFGNVCESISIHRWYWYIVCFGRRTIMRAPRRIKWHFILLLLFYVLHADVYQIFSIFLSPSRNTSSHLLLISVALPFWSVYLSLHFDFLVFAFLVCLHHPILFWW